jgi:putative ABC transport system permease protein
VRWPAAAQLVQLSLGRNRKAAWSSVFGLAVGIAALVFFVSLGVGISRLVRTNVFPFDAAMLEVVPSPLAFGLLGGGAIDPPAVERLTTLPHVVGHARKMNVRVPAVSIYSGDFFGRPLRMGLEIAAVGVDSKLFSDDVKPADFQDAGAAQPIPVVASTRIIEIYNKTFAPVRGLPQLSGSLLRGFTFPVEFNRSMVTPTKGGATLPMTAHVVGLSDRAMLAGLTIPFETAKRINQATQVDAVNLSALSLQLDSPEAVPELTALVKSMGFGIDDSERKMAESAGIAVALTSTAFTLLSLLICLLAAFNIAHAFSASVRARQKDLGVFRAVGATRGDLRTLVLLEATVLGLLGGLLGILLAGLSAVLVDTSAQRLVPDFPFKPESYFASPWWLWAVALAVGVLAAILGAAWPAQQAARADPASVLSQ